MLFLHRRYPVLLQGPTSVGKTSLINWLAQASGNVCVRINNHEHTDLQEYVGCYAASETGKLVFKEGTVGGRVCKDLGMNATCILTLSLTKHALCRCAGGSHEERLLDHP